MLIRKNHRLIQLWNYLPCRFVVKAFFVNYVVCGARGTCCLGARGQLVRTFNALLAVSMSAEPLYGIVKHEVAQNAQELRDWDGDIPKYFDRVAPFLWRWSLHGCTAQKHRLETQLMIYSVYRRRERWVGVVRGQCIDHWPCSSSWSHALLAVALPFRVPFTIPTVATIYSGGAP